jgi:polysaccharide biosynthesis transport protein
LEKLDALLKDKIREQAEQTKGFGSKTISLEGQKEEIELVERVWKTVGAEVEALKVEIDAPARVTSSPDESAYATKHENTPLKVTLGAGFGGFGLVLFGIIFLEFRARRLANADEVS